MEKINFKTPDWEDAQKVLSFFMQETTCMNRFGKLTVCPKYVVAMGDDAVSAYYAVCIANLAYKQFLIKPTLLCAGGVGKFSKYMNRAEDGTVLTEGYKLWTVIRQLGNFYSCILSDGNNMAGMLKEIISHLLFHDASGSPVIFCLTQRTSKLVERMVAYSTNLFRGTAPLNAYYYVPGESIQEMCQMYNGRAIADGLPLLSEVAALYDCMNRYSGVCIAEMDKHIDRDIVRAGENLVRKYPVLVSRWPFTAPLQFWKMYSGMRHYRQDIAEDLQLKITEWKRCV